MSIDTVSDLPPRVQYTAAAAQTVFPYTFPIFQDADLVVEVDGAVQTLTTDYAVSGEGDDTGGNVTLVVALAGGEIVTIYRDTVIERTSDFQQNGPFFSASVNDEFDRLFIIAQELKSKIGRAIRFPFNAQTTDAQQELNPISNWLGKFLRVSAAGILEAAELVSSVVPLTQSLIGQLLNPRTQAEIDADVTVVNYAIPSHTAIGVVIPNRYGNNTTPGTTDMLAAETAAQAVVAQLGTGGKIQYLPQVYYSSDTVTCNSDRVTVEGEGKHATVWAFSPASAKARFKFQATNPANVIYQCSVRRGCFTGSGSQQKIAVDLYDNSEFLLDDVATRTWTGNSGSASTPSISVRTIGREFTTIRQCDLYADRPIHVLRNANFPSVSADHFHFEDVLLGILVSTESGIHIDADAGISNWSSDGYFSVSGGKRAIYYLDGTEPSAALNIAISNLRYEQPADLTGHTVDWNCSTINLAFLNCGFGGNGSPTNGGLRLRNVSKTTLVSSSYSGQGEALNADSTCGKIETKGCFFQTGGTASLTGLMVVNKTPNSTSGPVPETGLIMPTGAYEEVIASTVSGYSVTLATDGVTKLGGSTQLGYVEIVDESTQVSALFSLSGTNADTNLKMEDPSAGFFTVTKDNASTRNVYWDAGPAEYRLQNKTAGSRTFRIRRTGRT